MRVGSNKDTEPGQREELPVSVFMMHQESEFSDKTERGSCQHSEGKVWKFAGLTNEIDTEGTPSSIHSSIVAESKEVDLNW